MNSKNKEKVLSIFIRQTTRLDEVDGELVAAAIAYYEDGELIDSFFGKCLDVANTTSIFPFEMINVERTHSDPLSLTVDFLNFYKKYKMGSTIVSSALPHMLIEMYNYGKANNIFEGENVINYPYPMLDVISMYDIVKHIDSSIDWLLVEANESEVVSSLHKTNMNIYNIFKDKYIKEVQ